MSETDYKRLLDDACNEIARLNTLCETIKKQLVLLEDENHALKLDLYYARVVRIPLEK